jgi:hypothetical protein
MTKKSGKTNGNASAGEIDLPDIAPPDPVLAAVEAEQAEAKKKVDRLEAVESELSALREKIRGMEAEREKHAAELENAKVIRRQFAFNASDGDAEAQEILRAARATQTEAALQLEDSQAAVDEARRRFDVLDVERDQLAPSEPWHGAMVLAKDLLAEDGEKIDFHIAGLIEVLSGHQQKLEALKALARDAGRERAFGNCGTRQVMRIFSTRMAAIWPLEYDKFSSVYQKNSYGQILKMQIANGIGVDLGTSPESEPTSPTTTVEATEENAQA